MAWPPQATPRLEANANVAGFGARRMQEEQQREADYRQQQWQHAEAERHQYERQRQHEAERHHLELEKQRLAWEWSELQRRQQEHEHRLQQFQQEQAHAAEQQRLQLEQEQQRLYQEQQQRFQEHQQRLEQQQQQLEQQQRELQEQQRHHQDAVAEQQRQLKKAEIDLERKLKSQVEATEKLQEELQQQQQQQHQLQLQLQQKLSLQQTAAPHLDDVGDETLLAVAESPARTSPLKASKQSTRSRPKVPPISIKATEQRTKAWAAERADSLMGWCADCRQEVLLSQMDSHACMLRNDSNGSSQDSAMMAPERVRLTGLTAESLTPSPRLRSRSPFFERHHEYERARNAASSPLSPALSPVWPEFRNVSRANSNEGPVIRRTPSDDERERLVSTPSPIPPDLSPEEVQAIRAERKRRIEAQREAKRKDSAAATAIISALKFDSLARTAPASSSRSISPSPVVAAPSKVAALSDSGRQHNGLPLEEYPSSSSLASTGSSSLLSATRRTFQREREHSQSSGAMTPSTSCEFSNGPQSSPDLQPSLPSGRLRSKSNASQKAAQASHGTSAGLRSRLDSAGAVWVGRSRLDSDPAPTSGLRVVVDTKTNPVPVPSPSSSPYLSSSRNLASVPSPKLDGGARSPGSSTVRLGPGGGGSPSPATLELPLARVESAAMATTSRARSKSVSPLSSSRPSIDTQSGTGTGTRKPAGDTVDLRGIEDLMRGIESDEFAANRESARRRGERERERERERGRERDRKGLDASRSPRKYSVPAALGSASPTLVGSGSTTSGAQLRARPAAGGSLARPPLAALRTGDRLRS